MFHARAALWGQLRRARTKSFCTRTTKSNNGDKIESNVSSYNEAYKQLDKLDFMTAAKMLFTQPPKKKQFGVPEHNLCRNHAMFYQQGLHCMAVLLKHGVPGWRSRDPDIMNADAIANLCVALSLKEKEGPLKPLQIALKDDGEKWLALRLVGKVMSDKMINRVAFIATIPKIWRTMEDVEIEVIDGNVFSFTFKNEKDLYQVLQGGPWSFNKSIMVLLEPQGKGAIHEMSFSEVAFWVQIHYVPLLCMTKDIDVFLGRMISKVQEIDSGPSDDCVGKYIKVRVVINVNQPLRLLCVDVLRDGTESTMLLRYERLSEHSYRCGRI
ncbi:hypothetical protein EZV62_019105 [Acer yangbiense]|uniref:DUF4283 domain-containing protein n=1 Tax=Acer yangbiense TaxID=1000413 RepID=A0A5C7HAP5_9ROSI|nr:hypothetical protein EZV62_019105 [Acer yangbiense]